MEKEPDKTGENRDKQGKFVKGVSGNPKGRPKGSLSLVSMLKQELEKEEVKLEGEDKKITYALALVKRILEKAIVHKDMGAIRDIFHMVDGLPRQKIEWREDREEEVSELMDLVENADEETRQQLIKILDRLHR